jgi:peptide/nickel transport system ATP-binding protein
MTALLEVDDLHVQYPGGGRGLAGWLRGQPAPLVRAVNGVSLRVAAGEAVGLVGESGCGKSTFGRALFRLTPAASGAVRFAGQDVLQLQGDALMSFRRRAQMVFQDPLASLNPHFSVFETLAEVLRVHRLCPPEAVAAAVDRLLEQVGLPATLADRKGRSLSGGQCQRVGIARALAVGAELIVADEPVSALDVSIQAQILNLLVRLQRERRLTLVFISHNLGVVRYLCSRVIVMYLGRIVEEGPVEAVLSNPRHPYTRSLVDAIPQMAPDARLAGSVLGGEPPSVQHQPAGCTFHPRCPQAMDICRSGPSPAARDVEERRVCCHLYPPSPGANGTRASATPAIRA